MTQTNSTECAVQEPENNVKQQGSNVVDLLSLSENGATSQTLELIKIGEDDSLIVPFTARSVETVVHFCKETEINGYVCCNGDGCVLCRIGKKQEPRLLLPVYVPMERLVKVLPLSRSFRPGALLPQILNVLKAETRSVVIVSRQNMRYVVATRILPDDADDGATQIRSFLEEWDAGRVDLTAVYQRIDNGHLAVCEGISQAMRVLGIKDDKGGRV